MRMVLVTWLDTNENSVGGWIEKDDLDKSEVCSVDSLGWLYKENDELIVILADKDTHDKDDIYGSFTELLFGTFDAFKIL